MRLKQSLILRPYRSALHAYRKEVQTNRENANRKYKNNDVCALRDELSNMLQALLP